MFGALLVLLATAAQGMPTAPATAQVASEKDWTEAVAATPESGIRIGNPDAPIRIVEYLSLTCSHCAEFSAEGMFPLLEEFIAPGRVSLELRPYPLDAVAATAAQLTQCLPPKEGFILNHGFLKEQDGILSRWDALSAEQLAAIDALPAAEKRVRVASEMGLMIVAAHYGLPEDQARACLTDPDRAARLEEASRAAEAQGVTATPSFLINGAMAGPQNWTTLEPLIKQAGG